jgi:hypothetical protein
MLVVDVEESWRGIMFRTHVAEPCWRFMLRIRVEPGWALVLRIHVEDSCWLAVDSGLTGRRPANDLGLKSIQRQLNMKRRSAISRRCLVRRAYASGRLLTDAAWKPRWDS